MDKKNEKIIKYSFIVMFLILTVIYGVGKLHKISIDSTYSNLIKSNKEGGISLTTDSVFFKENGEKAGGVLLELKPGDEFKGKLIAKNHYISQSIVHFDQLAHFTLESNIDKKDISVKGNNASFIDTNKKENNDSILLSIEGFDSGNSFNLKEGEVKDFDYKIKILKNAEIGEYSGQISLVEDKLMKNDYVTGQFANATFIQLASGVDVKLKITDNPKPYKSQKKITSSVKEIIEKTFYRNLKIFSSIILIVISLLFLVKGIKSKK